MVLSEEDANTIELAETYLNNYPGDTEPSTRNETTTVRSIHSLNPRDILKAVLGFAPTEAGKVNMAKAIMNAVGEEASETVSNARLEEFASQIVCNLLAPLKTKGGTTPREPSTPPSHLGLDPEEVASIRGPSIRRVARFNYTCPMTEWKDDSSPHLTENDVTVTLKCPHIIPHFLGETSKSGRNDHDKIATWVLLDRFAGWSVHEYLDGARIDSLKNALILIHDHSLAFGGMRLWFTEPADPCEKGIYDVHVWRNGEEVDLPVGPMGKRGGDKIDLRSVSPQYEEVSADLLRVHASLCQVLNVSGAGDVIQKILLEWDGFRWLAEDGKDADLLSARLSLIQAF